MSGTQHRFSQHRFSQHRFSQHRFSQHRFSHLTLGLVVCTGLWLCSAPRLEGRGSPGCSPGRSCSSATSVNPAGDESVILADALDLHPITNRPLGFYPNCYADGPQVPATQTIRWKNMIAYDVANGARVRLNPDFVSTTTMRSLQPGGVPFFPAQHAVDLYLEWQYPDGLRLFNKQAIALDGSQAMTGFPPLQGPDYVMDTPVELFDKNNPDGPAMMTINSSRIHGDVQDLFAIEIVRQSAGVYTIRVSTHEPGLQVPARILTDGTRGYGPVSAAETDALITNQPFEMTVTAAEPSAPCFDYFEVWAVSLNSARQGMSSSMYEPPNAGSCQAPDPRADAGGHIHAAPGERVTLHGFGESSRGAVRYCWSAPNGVTIDDPTSPTPSFTAPDLGGRRDLVFALFVDDGTEISPPSYAVVNVVPEGPLPPPIPIPTLSPAGLVLAALMLLGAGAFVLIRRRG